MTFACGPLNFAEIRRLSTFSMPSIRVQHYGRDSSCGVIFLDYGRWVHGFAAIPPSSALASLQDIHQINKSWLKVFPSILGLLSSFGNGGICVSAWLKSFRASSVR